MNFEETFPLRYYINLGRREKRRAETEWNLDQVGVTAERFPAIDARFVRNPRGYENKGRYALSLTIRLAIRRAKKLKAPSLFLFEDDVILHPNFGNLVSRIDLPDDWGLFYLGCQHQARPEPFTESLVKVLRGLDSHAWAIHERAYDEVMHILNIFGKESLSSISASDRFVAILQRKIPTYACFPNLAWQAVTESDLTGTKYSLYGMMGAQKIHPEKLENFVTQCVAPEVIDKPVKLGLLFLTKGDVHHPDIWAEWVAQSPNDVVIFSHAKNPEMVKDGFLEGTQISEHLTTRWGDVSLVRATISLLRAGLKNETITHFALVSESCVPVQPLGKVLQNLKYDGRCQFGYTDSKNASEFSKFRFRKAKEVPESCWRFHQQWWLLDRAASKFVVRNDYTKQFEGIFASDEGYFGTVLILEGYPLDDLVYNENVTWAHWPKLEEKKESAKNDLVSPRKARSPKSHCELIRQHLVEILRSDAIFARKFPKDADIKKYQLHLP